MSARMLLTDAERYPFTEAELASLPPGFEVVELRGHDPEEIRALAAGADAVFVYHGVIDADLVGALSRCRVIVRCGTGYEKIDVAAARAAGIEVTYVPDYGSTDVAGHALALMLASLRKIPACDALTRGGEWPTYPDLRPMRRIEEHVLGLLGFGRIARSLAAKASALGMTILAHDPQVEGPADPATGARLVDFDALVSGCDVLSVHVPLSAGTRGLIDAGVLASMRPGATLVSTSRGGIVVEDALVGALASGRLAGAALDVFESEPLPAGSPLLGRRDVVLTPHTAAYSEEALGELRRRSLAEAVRVLGGEAPRDPVPGSS